MTDLRFVKKQYLDLREAFIKFLDKFEEESYFYQPTVKSNSTAWIVPHVSAFEKLMVTDKIPGYKFEEFITEENVAKYRPGADGFVFGKQDMMNIDEAISLLLRTKDVSIRFLDNIIDEATSAKDVNAQIALDKYLSNYSHETEHYGQLKYLLGTWKRLNSE
ncbi:MAG: DinB family protein [Candidatus Thorarchaeota archaeon]|jgi:hypothetical protein